MHFNLLTVSKSKKVFNETLISPLTGVDLASKNSVVKAHVSTKTTLHPKYKARKSINIQEIQVTPLPGKTLENPLVKNSKQERPDKVILVARQVDNIIVMPARFKTLPPLQFIQDKLGFGVNKVLH